jgi:outer membrane protein OmpA-like peptidoglycan-associated protein
LTGGNPDVANPDVANPSSSDAAPSSAAGSVEAGGSLAIEGQAANDDAGGSATATSDGVNDGETEAGPDDTSADEATTDEQAALRAQMLRNQNSLRGSTGLLRVHSASSGPQGTFRVSFLGSYMSATGFLCPQCEDRDGGDPSLEDEMSRQGVHAQLSATVLPFLEAYLGVHSWATSNSRGNPTLLQTLTDTTWGVKGFLPYKEDRLFNVGGSLELWMLNGSGSVGIDNASVAIRALGTADFTNRSKASERLPLRLHMNISYIFDNSGGLVEADEAERNQRISRIERFGLNINRVDQLVPALAVEGVFKYVNPFLEWSIDVPSNRQSYECAPAELAASDECLDSYTEFTAVPARLTLGARGYALLDGLSVFGALDVATGGVNAPFWEEMQPEAPWNLYFGIAYAVDTKPKIVERVIVAPALPTKAAQVADNLIAGRVIEEGSADVPVPNAVVRYEGLPLTGMVTDEQGKFETRPLAFGEYRFAITASGFEPGVCSSKLEAAPTGATPQGASTSVTDGEAKLAPNVTQLVCQLKAKPKVGNIDGSIAGATGTPIADAKVSVTDKLGRSLTLQADGTGAFRFENVPPGPARVQVAAPGYLATSRAVEVPPGQDLHLNLALNPVPVPANVVVAKNLITLRKPIDFRPGSKELLPEASALLDEVATMLLAHPELAQVEVQSHTNNASPPVVSMQLSQQRAEVIVSQLVDRGVPAGRLRAQGYGDSQPVAPNTTDFGRKKNERVQLVAGSGGM